MCFTSATSTISASIPLLDCVLAHVLLYLEQVDPVDVVLGMMLLGIGSSTLVLALKNGLTI